MKLLEDFRNLFTPKINLYLKEKEEQFKKIDKQATFLIKIIQEFIGRGGKRFRPAIFYYSYLTYSKKNLEKILKLSFVFELFHTFALIHDDIIDNSDLRRNKPTVHKQYDTATAILVGDLALMLADELFFTELGELKLDGERRTKAIRLFNLFKQEVLAGEYLDYKKTSRVYKIMELKTARYSFMRPAMMGFNLAEAPEKEILQWEKILREIGILFQIKDDFVGTFGDEKIIGKPIDSDIKEGKKTLITKEFLQRCNNKEKERLYSFFGKGKLRQEDFLWYKKLLFKYKIFNELKEQIIKNAEETEKKLDLYLSKKLLTELLKEILVEIVHI